MKYIPIEKFHRSSFLGAVVMLVSGTAIAQALPIMFTPLISRLFSPDDFGMLGLFNAFISITAGVAGLSFPLAIVSDIPRRESAQLVLLSLIVTVPVTAGLVAVLWVMARYQLLGFHELPGIAMASSGLVLIALGLFRAFRYWQLREQNYARISRSEVVQSMGLTVAQLLTGLVSLGGGGLILSEVVRRSAGVANLAKASWEDVREAANSTTMAGYWQLAKDYRKFPLLSTPSSLVDSLSMALPAPLFVSAYGLAQAGHFSMSYRVLALPVALIGAAVADVFHGQLARTAGKDKSEIRRLFLRVAAGLFALGLIPSIVVILWGPPLFTFVLGSQWEQAGHIAAGIMPWILFSFVVGPLSRVVLVFQGQELKLIYDISALLGVVGGIWLGVIRGWPIEQTSQLLGVTQSVAYVLYFGLLWRIILTNSR